MPYHNGMTHDQLLTTMKAQAWADLTGKLWSFAALEGSRSNVSPADTLYARLSEAIERFLTEVEDARLHE